MYTCCVFSYRGLEFVAATRTLRIRTVQPFHAGIYRCRGLGLEELCVYYSDNATVTVRGTYAGYSIVTTVLSV